MLDHLGVTVSDLSRSKAFYASALAPLGYRLMVEGPDYAGFGTRARADFWIGAGKTPTSPPHIAFHAPDRGKVHAFHEAALNAGGKDNGPPGVRPIYHPHYYAAFILDPDGHNIEAVCHAPA